ncbi:MAG: NAD kinase [Bacteroidaceae bacterium]|nr:NAD kinase [Bacteroidaceae bacterium]
MHKLRFALFGNVYQTKKSALAKDLLCCLERHRAEVYIDRHFHDYLTRELQLNVNPSGLIDNDEFLADFVISMGGDGTFLQTASRVGDKGIPIIGLNMGRMGFLADVSGSEIDEAIGNIFEHRFKTESRSVLQLDYSCGKPSLYPFALNEVAVLKQDNSSMISIRVHINGEYLTTYQADGLIINTPTGSTGYALSVGGSIMSPNAGTLGITPVAAHSLNVRPVSICDNAEVTLTVGSRSHNFLVAVDGRSETCSEDTALRIRKAPYTIQVVKRPGSSFFRTLREKLMWGNDVRN